MAPDQNRRPMTHHRKNTSSIVLRYLIEKTGQLCFHEDIAKDVDLSRSQVSSAVNNLLGAHNIERPGNGQVIYRGVRSTNSHSPSHSTENRLFEELATTKTGDLLIQDQNGVVYRATEL